MEDRIEQAAALLADLRLRRGGVRPPLDDLPEAVRPRDTAEAYAVQSRLAERLIPHLGPVAGWKIGCTTEVMRAYLGVDQPCAGAMFGNEIRCGDADLIADDYRKLGLECEIAVRLAHDMGGAPDPTQTDPAQAVGAIMCSVEIVEERFTDFARTATATLVADNFFGAGCVLGAEAPLDRDLKSLRGGFSVNGAAPEHTGVGAAIMGDPMAALGWLAAQRAPSGGLKAGEVVTLGSVVKTIYPRAGDVIEASFDGLAPVVITVR